MKKGITNAQQKDESENLMKFYYRICCPLDTDSLTQRSTSLHPTQGAQAAGWDFFSYLKEWQQSNGFCRHRICYQRSLFLTSPKGWGVSLRSGPGLAQSLRVSWGPFHGLCKCGLWLGFRVYLVVSMWPWAHRFASPGFSFPAIKWGQGRGEAATGPLGGGHEILP